MNFADGKITEIRNKTISRRPLATHQTKVTFEVETSTEKSVLNKFPS